MAEKMSTQNFKNVVSSIANEIRLTQINTVQQVNRNLIILYFRIGKILDENSKYGNGFIMNIKRTKNGHSLWPIYHGDIIYY